MAIKLRELTAGEQDAIKKLARSRTASARTVERARIICQALSGKRVPAIAQTLGVAEKTVRTWLKRFNADGLAGLHDLERAGRPATYTPAEKAEVIAASLTKPEQLGLPFACWTIARLAAYLNEQKGIAIKRSRVSELLITEGLRWRTQETWFGERVDPEFAEKRGALRRFTPPEGSWVIDVDQMGPVSAKSYAGQQALRPQPQEQPRKPAERARQEIDYGSRGKGYIFGAFRPTTGEALTRDDTRRTAANWVDFLAQVDEWIPAEVERVYAILDNLKAHRAPDVLLFSLHHPRWEFVFQPKDAAYLNLIEPWWKVLRSLALKGRRFETWEEVAAAVKAATEYWNSDRHPFIWGRRRRHKSRREPGIALVAKAA